MHQIFLSAIWHAVVSFGSESWNYDDVGPSDWASIYSECGGHQQSPINVDSNAVLNGFDEFSDLAISSTVSGNVFSDQNIWDWNSDYICDFTVTNNGHTVKFKSSKHETLAQLTNMFDESDDFQSGKFCLDSIHLHWGKNDSQGSEHRLFSTQYPAEMHFVHYNCDYSSLSEAVTASLNATDGKISERPLAVVGIFFQIDDEATSEETSVIEAIVNESDVLENVSSILNISNVDFNSVMPSSTETDDLTFWYYRGSLTTPECNEIVHWHLLNSKAKIKSSQLEILRSMQSGEHGVDISHNWRPPQNNTNDVYQFQFQIDTTTQEPQSAAYIATLSTVIVLIPIATIIMAITNIN